MTALAAEAYVLAFREASRRHLSLFGEAVDNWHSSNGESEIFLLPSRHPATGRKKGIAPRFLPALLESPFAYHRFNGVWLRAVGIEGIVPSH